MANDAAVREAEAIFVDRLNVEPRVAARLVRLIETNYSNEIDAARRLELFQAARWAADRLRSRRGEVIGGDIKAALEGSGCPLCASAGQKSHGTREDGGSRGGQSKGGA